MSKRLTMSNGSILGPVATITEHAALVVKNGMFVAGAISILAIDLLTGPIFLGNFNTTGSVTTTATFWAISLALTATQMIFWDYVKRGGFDRSKWQSYAPAIVVGFLMIIDTLMDVGFVTQLLYPDTPPFQFLPDKIELIWYMLTIVVGSVSLFCEPLLMWFFGRLKPVEPT